MQEVINILINENYNGVRNTINGPKNKDINSLLDAINGVSVFDSNIIYMFLYLMSDKYGNCDNIFDILGVETKYNKDNISILLEFNKLNDISVPKINIAKEQIEDYETYYGWDLQGKYLFPCNGSLYSLLAISKLMESEAHKNKFQNEYDRYKYIIENQIYIIGEDAISNFYLSCIIDINNELKKNIFTGDVFSQKYVNYRNNVIFTAAIGEPTVYDGKTKRSYNYVYYKYITKYIAISRVTCMLTPCRWFQTESGDFKYLIKFRESIKNSNRVRLLNYFNVEPDPEHTGGLSYLIIDVNYNGACLYKKENLYVDLRDSDIILKNAGYYLILNKIKSIDSLDSSYLTSGWSNILTNDKRLTTEQKPGSIKVYVSDRTGGIKWIPISLIKEPLWFFDWKVFVPETVTTGVGFNDKFILAGPCEMCNQTFCGFRVKSAKQGKSLISYLKTEFASKILLFRKIKNHINKHSLSYLPSVPLDREWNDDKLTEYFKLNSQEKQIIYG